MFNLLLALITGIVLGWNFHSFFIKLTPIKILTDINISKTSEEKIIVKMNVPKQIIKKPEKSIELAKEVPLAIPHKEENLSIIVNQKNDTFYDFLENDLFSDAMTLYVDVSEEKLTFYQSALVKYFEVKSKSFPQEAIDQMIELQELEPSERKINIETLHEIEDDNYLEKAKILLNLLKEKMQKSDEYGHHIPLKKVGDHFTINVHINNEPITLLLDTGATLTMINTQKLTSPLKIINENIILNTAGGKINATLQEADLFSIGNIKLQNFQIVSSSFEQKNADGLLGMNFFKKFEFKIDQEKHLLYLSKKQSSN